jgi:hypothetical protein
VQWCAVRSCKCLVLGAGCDRARCNCTDACHPCDTTVCVGRAATHERGRTAAPLRGGEAAESHERRSRESHEARSRRVLRGGAAAESHERASASESYEPASRNASVASSGDTGLM